MRGKGGAIWLAVAYCLGVLSAVFLPDIIIIVLLTAMLLLLSVCLLR